MLNRFAVNAIMKGHLMEACHLSRIPFSARYFQAALKKFIYHAKLNGFEDIGEYVDSIGFDDAKYVFGQMYMESATRPKSWDSLNRKLGQKVKS